VLEALQNLDAYKTLKSTQRNGIITAVMNALSVKDETADPVLDKEGDAIPDKSLSTKENVPFMYEGGSIAFFDNEIKPFIPDAWVDNDGIKVGYEISFTKYFFKPAELREVGDIIADIEQIERDTDGLLTWILNEVRR
jgi:type I restriction enzyme M protein